MHQLVNIILAVLLFGFIIFFHELGHFLAARLFGVGVDSFSLGMGPKIIAKKRGDTEYAIRAVPFGGFCAMQGEDESKRELRPGDFTAHAPWQRFFILIAGACFNFLLAFLLGLVLVMQTGVDKPYIGQLMPGMPAEEAGLKAGDRILAVNGSKAVFFRDVSMALRFHAGEPITFRYETPAGEKRTVTVTPKYLKEQDGYYTGIVSAGSMPVKNPAELVYYAAGEVGLNIRMAIQSVRLLIKGAVSPKNLTGPVGIVQAISENMDAARPYGLRVMLLSLFSFGLLLSANLGVMNLLPLPALDGGRALLTAVEAVIRRPLNRKIEATVHLTGFVLLMGLMLYVLWNDIMRIVQHTGF